MIPMLREEGGGRREGRGERGKKEGGGGRGKGGGRRGKGEGWRKEGGGGRQRGCMKLVTTTPPIMVLVFGWSGFSLNLFKQPFLVIHQLFKSCRHHLNGAVLEGKRREEREERGRGGERKGGRKKERESK